MTLRQVMADDLMRGHVWFDDTEMGGYHNVNGARLLCVVDGAAMAETVSSAKSQEQRRGEGIQTGSLTLYLRADEYKGLAQIGGALVLDGRRYRIISTADDEGVLALGLIEVRVRC